MRLSSCSVLFFFLVLIVRVIGLLNILFLSILVLMWVIILLRVGCSVGFFLIMCRIRLLSLFGIFRLICLGGLGCLKICWCIIVL